MTSLDSTVQPKIGSFQAVSILTCTMLFYLYEYILRVSPSVMTDGLMRDFGVTSTALGVLVSFYYYAYVPLQVPCGVIVDWFGPRRIVSISALLCTVGAFIFSQSDSLFLAQIGRFLMGAGSACAYLSCMKVGSVWFSADKFALISGIAMMMGTLGGTFGGRPFAILVNARGWHEAMMITSMAGMAVTVAAWMIVRDYPKGYVCPHAHNTDQKVGFLDGLKVVASNPQNWLIGLYGLMMYLPLSVFAELWAVPYLMQRYGVTNEVAASASVMLFIGMAVGSPLGAWLSEKLQSRLKVMSWSALSTTAVFLAIIYFPNINFETMRVLQFLTGLLSGGQILYFAAAKEINPSQTSATTIGFTNALLMTSGAIFQPALGLILDLVWDGQYKADGTPLYSLQNYQTALVVVALGPLAGWGILKFIYETHPSAKNKPG